MRKVHLGVHLMLSSLLLGLTSTADVTTEPLVDVTRTQAVENLKGCETPFEPHGVLLSARDQYGIGDTVQIHCNQGYRVPHTMAPMLHLKCGSDGLWRNLLEQESVAHCKPTGSCTAPHVAHSTVPNQPDGYMPDHFVRMTCAKGYKPPLGGEMITCRSGGTWEMLRIPGREPVCLETSCILPEEIPNGHYTLSLTFISNATRPVPDGSSVTYSCNYGYRISDVKLHQRECTRGVWTMEAPKCVKASFKSCVAPKLLPHGDYVMKPNALQSENEVPEGYYVTYSCDTGYLIAGQGHKSQQSLLCLNGEWTGNFPTCIPETLKECFPPPNITNGNFLTIEDIGLNSHPKKYTEGIKVYYYCDNGFRLTDKANASVLSCIDENWVGTLPACEKRNHCDRPLDIQNGNWVLDLKFFRKNFGIGTRIKYECLHGFKPMGSTTIECLSSGYWSDYAPRCLAANKYCSEPGHVENGVYMCQPSHCDLFKVGTEVQYVCNKDYVLDPPDMQMQMCLSGGIWTGKKPVCKEAKAVATDTYVNFNASTLTVVIATSCGVLGLLVVVMVVVALQRRKKPRMGRLCHPSTPPPPPYNPTPPTGLVDDPDRVALIAFADGVQVVLPSYEEAIRSRPGSRMSRYTSDRGSIRSSSSRDYRPLPSLRTGGPQIREVPPDHHRNSIITTASTTTRDNLSLALGSIDTMNISDGTSTSVTVDTASSNPSIATSQRATAGSIESSSTNGSLAVTEDAPLLDQNHYNTETIRSHHSTASDTHPHGNNATRCQCSERISGYDTLRSQGSRSQSESSPIVEVPEEQKDT